jgi:hypothetical protein
MKIGRGNRSTRRKPAPAPLCPPQIPGRRGGKPATNGLSYGAAWLHSCCWAVSLHVTIVSLFLRPGALNVGNFVTWNRKVRARKIEGGPRANSYGVLTAVVMKSSAFWEWNVCDSIPDCTASRPPRRWGYFLLYWPAGYICILVTLLFVSVAYPGYAFQNIYCNLTLLGARDSAVGWGIMLQTEMSGRSLDFSIDLILPAALWP